MAKKNKNVEPEIEKIEAEQVEEQKEIVEVQKPAEKAEPKPVAEEYTAEEFYQAARTLFGVAPELVRAAFRCNKVTKCTKDEAIKIVETFKNKEVK